MKAPSEPSWTHGSATIGALPIQHGVEAGRADATEAVVRLYGFPQHAWMWKRVLPALAGRCRVIAPDQRGMGGTGIAPAGYDKATGLLHAARCRGAVHRRTQAPAAGLVLPALGGEGGAGACRLPAGQALALRVEGGAMDGAGHRIADEPPASLVQRPAGLFFRVETADTRP